MSVSKENKLPILNRIKSLEEKIKKVSSEKTKKELLKEVNKIQKELEKENSIYYT